jgi:hypothetical protein
MKRLLVMLIACLIGTFLVSGVAMAQSRSQSQSTSAVKGFDTCFNCFGQDPQQAWFTTEHANGYQLMVIDPDTWSSEFPDGKADDPGSASQCELAADSRQLIDNAVYAGMRVAIYNRNPNCWRQSLDSLGRLEKLGTPVYVWDVETQPGLVPTQADVATVTKMGYDNAVYTWDGAVPANLTEFHTLPLFVTEVANWDTPDAGPAADFPATTSIAPFDGWTAAQMEQDSTGQLSGIRVDFDSVNAAWLDGLRHGDAASTVKWP